MGLQLFVSIWFQILFHLPHRDTFNLSLTVLVHYRSLRIFSLGAIVAPDSNGISPVPPYLRTISYKYFIFTYGIITLYDRSFQRHSVNKIFSIPIKRVRLPRNPKSRRTWFRLFRFRSPLLTESQLISFPPGTKMFQFPGCASLPYIFR